MKRLYKGRYNPISPQFIYECLFRVFSRKNHCLANDNKPLAVVVVFRYAKMFDDINFEDQEYFKKYFDTTLSVEFVNYKDQNISEATLETIINAFNLTPPGMTPLEDSEVDRVLYQIE